jgi:hypothetical protein
MKRLMTTILIAASACSSWAGSQKDVNNCPDAASMGARELQGRWRATIQGLPESRLQLGPHPEMSESVFGTVQRGSTTAQVAGDVDDGALTLEESEDGKRISATWLGDVVEGSCGAEIRGTWSSAAAPDKPIPFTLRKP